MSIKQIRKLEKYQMIITMLLAISSVFAIITVRNYVNKVQHYHYTVEYFENEIESLNFMIELHIKHHSESIETLNSLTSLNYELEAINKGLTSEIDNLTSELEIQKDINSYQGMRISELEEQLDK